MRLILRALLFYNEAEAESVNEKSPNAILAMVKDFSRSVAYPLMAWVCKCTSSSFAADIDSIAANDPTIC